LRFFVALQGIAVCVLLYRNFGTAMETLDSGHQALTAGETCNKHAAVGNIPRSACGPRTPWCWWWCFCFEDATQLRHKNTSKNNGIAWWVVRRPGRQYIHRRWVPWMYSLWNQTKPINLSTCLRKISGTKNISGTQIWFCSIAELHKASPRKFKFSFRNGSIGMLVESDPCGESSTSKFDLICIIWCWPCRS